MFNLTSFHLVGGGIGGIALAVALQQLALRKLRHLGYKGKKTDERASEDKHGLAEQTRFISVVCFEKDSGQAVRRQGYALTMQQVYFVMRRT